MPRGLGNEQKKMLTLIMSGVALGLARNPKKHIKIVKEASEELTNLSKPNSERALTGLEKHKMIRLVQKRGYYIPVLTKKGKRQAFLEALNDIQINPQKKWDKRWRLVSFDVPEKQRWARNTFRFHLQRLGFYEVHQSLFAIPWPCEDEVRLIAQQLNINKCVHTAIAEDIDHSKRLRSIFKLPY
jgi:DNA-binding transcriptional regulator PaaX